MLESSHGCNGTRVIMQFKQPQFSVYKRYNDEKEELLPECVALVIGVEAVRSSMKDWHCR